MIIGINRTTNIFCFVRRLVLGAWTRLLLCAFNCHWAAVAPPYSCVLVLTVWVLGVAYSVFLNVVFVL